MKRLSFGLALLGLLLASGCVVTVDAQSLPITLYVSWSPNPPAEAVTAYTFILDGTPPQTIDPATCTASVCRSASFPINDLTVHTVSVTSTSALGTSTPSTATFTVKVSSPSGLKIQKG